MSTTPPRKGSSSDEIDKKVLARLKKEGELPEFSADLEKWDSYLHTHEVTSVELMSLFRELGKEINNIKDKDAETAKMVAVKTMFSEKIAQIKSAREGRLTPPSPDTLSSPQSGRSSPLSFRGVSPVSSGRVSPASLSGRVSPASSSSEMRIIPSIEEWHTDPPRNPNKPTIKAYYMQLHEKQINKINSKEDLSKYMFMLGEEDWNIGFLIFANKLVRDKCKEKKWGEDIKFDRQILETAESVIQSFNREKLISFMKYLGKPELKELELETLLKLNDLIKNQCKALNSKDEVNQPLTFNLDDVIKEKQTEMEEASTKGKKKPTK